MRCVECGNQVQTRLIVTCDACDERQIATTMASTMKEVAELSEKELRDELSCVGYDEDRVARFGRSCERLVRIHGSAERGAVKRILETLTSWRKEEADRARAADSVDDRRRALIRGGMLDDVCRELSGVLSRGWAKP